jgi:GT2 family glycosyltransferase
MTDSLNSYSVVIATCDREEKLARVLADWAAQTVRPEKVVVVRAKKKVVSRQVTVVSPEEQKSSLRSSISDLPLVELTADERSAAKQRNVGAEEVETEWIVFCDDDVQFGPALAEKTLEFLETHPEAVAVFPRMRGSGHPAPGNWLRKYYRFQAGFDDETYGAKLFGAGLSCYPCWERQPAPVETNWLPSTMLWMRADLFQRHRFPDFEGYSFGEDAHLTHRAWREAKQSGGQMFFLGEPDFEHLSIQSGIKASRFRLGKMTVRNQRRIAREAMGKGAWEVFWKSLLHRGFVTLALLKSRRPGWMGEMAGIWRG